MKPLILSALTCIPLLIFSHFSTSAFANPDSAYQRDDAPRTPLKVEEYELLEFGRVISSQRGRGSVQIDAATGEKRVNNGVVDLGGFHSPAKFLITGEPNARFEIILPHRDKLRGQKTGAFAKLESLKSVPENVGRLGADGKAWVLVGGELLLKNQSAADYYRGGFGIEVNYY